MQGSTTRADGVRTPLLEIVLDELTYDKDILDSFLQVQISFHFPFMVRSVSVFVYSLKHMLQSVCLTTNGTCLISPLNFNGENYRFYHLKF
ncbi:hypothetical protein RchiOBHm_Chr3g0477111 [Rosa chinensis]|uniref:Uncharacterized protein n=1 Tax=Rosa chinensis TaxID=74649 RepID=A0A2P6RCV4_ROSCH|nr:hypothetical protein RchiOBHm_Chr3g0477111 [Rosa chinensis]